MSQISPEKMAHFCFPLNQGRFDPGTFVQVHFCLDQVAARSACVITKPTKPTAVVVKAVLKAFKRNQLRRLINEFISLSAILRSFQREFVKVLRESDAVGQTQVVTPLWRTRTPKTPVDERTGCKIADNQTNYWNRKATISPPPTDPRTRPVPCKGKGGN